MLAGHSMGAHTAVAYALAHPERVAALVVDRAGLRRLDLGRVAAPTGTGSPTALESGGIDAFVDYIERVQGIDPAWRDSVMRFTRERMEAHRHLDAVAEALRQVPRSRPFESLAELEALDVPALVVASDDAADPGHPYATRRSTRERLPRARAGQRGRGAVAAGLAGRPALARDRAASAAADWPKSQE